MNSPLYLYVALTSFALAACLLAAILSPQVKDGISIKIGLGLMVLGMSGLGVIAMDAGLGCREVPTMRAVLLVNAGAVIVALGYGWRRLLHGRNRRRASDWVHR